VIGDLRASGYDEYVHRLSTRSFGIEPNFYGESDRPYYFMPRVIFVLCKFFVTPLKVALFMIIMFALLGMFRVAGSVGSSKQALLQYISNGLRGHTYESIAFYLKIITSTASSNVKPETDTDESGTMAKAVS